MRKEKNYSSLLVNAALCVSRPKGLQIAQPSFVQHKLVRKERKPSFLLVNAAQCVFPKGLQIVLPSFVWHKLVRKERKLSFLPVNAAQSVFLINLPSIVQLSCAFYQFVKKERY